MRAGFIALSGALIIAACGGGNSAPNPYPAEARTQFAASCPMDNPVCSCTWEQLTIKLTHDEYAGALDRFRETGLMDPRVTRARAHCLQRHPA